MPKKHNPRGQKVATHLQGIGYFNTVDLNAIGQAFYNTFEQGELVAEAVVDELGAKFPKGSHKSEKTAKLDEHFLDQFFWQHEAGATLVAELAAEGFKIVKER